MAATDFSPTNCPKCGKGIWSGLGYALIPLKLDSERLNLPNEIIAKLQGRRTYQAHRTAKSFEVTPRSVGYLGAVDPIVLAQHECSLMITFEEPPADPWGRDVQKVKNESMEVPF